MRRWLVLLGMLTMVAGCAADTDDLGTEVDALRQTCGGFAGFTCRDGFVCVDDPSDDCDPEAGGADCIGVCRRAPRDCRHGQGVTYVSRSTDQCAAIRFLCAEGTEPFFDDCGCGCAPIPGEDCGPVQCGEGQECCNASCGICVEPGGFCTQQICESEPIAL
jgi:hypothetical protein